MTEARPLRVVGLAVMALTILSPIEAVAHDLRPGVLSLREIAPSTFAVRTTPPRDGRGPVLDLTPVWPDGCAMAGGLLTCEGDLLGSLALPELTRRRVKCVVAIAWLDGSRYETLLTEGQGTAVIARPGETGRDALSIGWAYLLLGIEHIVLGLDHLLFVMGLALLIRDRRVLIRAVTGFTVAHALTLIAAALGWLTMPGAAVESLIAASILLLARDAVRAPDGPLPIVVRAPWLLVIPFGLLHGLGFAGALSATGLPSEHTVLALAAFNLGIELGQIAAVIVSALAFDRAVGIRRPFAWVMGVIAGYWTLERGLAWVASLLA